MDINDLILSDEALNVIDNGTWVDDFPEAPGLGLYVVGLNSEAAQNATRHKMQVQRGKNRGRPLSDDQLATITKEVLVDVVLKDWRGLKANGQDVKYSKEQAKQWIMSRKGERFTSLVLQAAQRVDSEASEFVEEATKN